MPRVGFELMIPVPEPSRLIRAATVSEGYRILLQRAIYSYSENGDGIDAAIYAIPHLGCLRKAYKQMRDR
jgi:hypothetical protein